MLVCRIGARPPGLRDAAGAAANGTGPDPGGFHLIHGTEIRLTDGTLLVLLACNRHGYGNLSELVTLARRAAGKGQYRIDRGTLQAQAHLLAGTVALLVPPLFERGHRRASGPLAGRPDARTRLDRLHAGARARRCAAPADAAACWHAIAACR